MLEPALCGGYGEIAVDAQPGGARVEIDGEPVAANDGAGAQARVEPGVHRVRVEAEGYAPWSGEVLVLPGERRAVTPRLVRVAAAEEPAVPAAEATAPAPRAAGEGGARDDDRGWHARTRAWLLARFDRDRSGALDAPEEIAAVPCDDWLGFERSHDQSGLRLPMLRFYGFDGEGWRSGALGVSDAMRDVAFERLKGCGLRTGRG